MLTRSGVASIVTIGLLALPSHVWPAQSLDQHHVMVWTAFDDSAAASVAAGARVNDTASDGTHPLPYAIVIGQSAFAHFLLEQGADPNGALDGITALHAAAGPVDTWLRAWNRRRGTRGSAQAE